LISNKNGKASYRDTIIPHHEHRKSKFGDNHILEEDNNSLDRLDSR